MKQTHSKLLGTILICLAVLAFGQPASAQKTLEKVRKHGALRCGVSEGLVGFSLKTVQKGWHGFDVDFCRAVAAAIFIDATKVEFIPLSATERFEVLSSGKIDVLSRNSTWNMNRDIVMDLDFVGVWYFDTQGLMVNKTTGPKRIEDINGETICALKGTTVASNLRDYLANNNLNAKILHAETRTDARRNYERGLCKIYASDLSALASERTRLADPGGHSFLPAIISKEPLGPVVRSDDARWRDLLQWVLFCLINAEEAGWTAAQAAKANMLEKITVSPEASARLGLRVEWARAVISQVGNYGEIFERNLGSDGGLGMARGLNALWLNQGLLYAPPMR